MLLKIDKTLSLVPINLGHAKEVHKSFTTAIIEFLPIETLSGKIEDTISFIENSMAQREKETDFVWAIMEANEFAECCGIHTIQSRKPHFGIWIKEEKQQKGIGKKVVQFVLDWGIKNLEVDFIKYPVDEKNQKSIHLIQDLGLELKDRYVLGEGKKLNILEYRLYRKTLG